MGMRRFTRLTNGFSKKLAFHLFAVALHTMCYNFVKPHGTLTKERGGIKTTPAMAAGLADRPWTVYDLLQPAGRGLTVTNKVTHYQAPPALDPIRLRGSFYGSPVRVRAGCTPR
jgi:hypothetical protein